MGIKRSECCSAFNGHIAKGCEHCINGSKMVLFVTGRCNAGCFYCPVSGMKMGKDTTYANEGPAPSPEDIIHEAESMDATGTGITGGDPLVEMDRTLGFIRLLKEHFGKEHHIHLYTAMMDYDKVKVLEEAGLDEIRFHPQMSQWSIFDNSELKRIVSGTKMDVGIEVPAIPDHREDLSHLIDSVLEAGVDFINLNEFEFSETNWNRMEERGYVPKDEVSSAIAGSEETALAIMKGHRRASIHFCSSTFKDGVQLRKRLIRRANRIAKEYDVVTNDGTLIKGVVYADDLDSAADLLRKEYEVPDVLIFIDKERNRMEVASWVLEELASELPFKCYITEEYASADRLEVERSPLN